MRLGGIGCLVRYGLKMPEDYEYIYWDRSLSIAEALLITEPTCTKLVYRNKSSDGRSGHSAFFAQAYITSFKYTNTALSLESGSRQAAAEVLDATTPSGLGG